MSRDEPLEPSSLRHDISGLERVEQPGMYYLTNIVDIEALPKGAWAGAPQRLEMRSSSPKQPNPIPDSKTN